MNGYITMSINDVVQFNKTESECLPTVDNRCQCYSMSKFGRSPSRQDPSTGDRGSIQTIEFDWFPFACGMFTTVVIFQTLRRIRWHNNSKQQHWKYSITSSILKEYQCMHHYWCFFAWMHHYPCQLRNEMSNFVPLSSFQYLIKSLNN